MNSDTLKKKMIEKFIESVDIPVLTDETEEKIYDAIWSIFEDLIKEHWSTFFCGIF